MSRALFLRHHEEDSPGLLGTAFQSRGFDVEVVLMDASTSTPRVDGYDVVVILGSKCAVYDREVEAAWFGRELAFIGEAVARSVPVLGVCFGAQALCRYFGGEVSRAPEGEVGWFDVDVVEGVELPAGPWFEYHFDHCTLPEGAEVWATSSRAIQAFALGRHVGVQFHPEIDEDQLREWFAADGDSARDLGLDVTALLEQTARETPASHVRARALVDLFLSRAV